VAEIDQAGQSIRVIVREWCPAVSPTPHAVYLDMPAGQSLVVGREGDLPAGVEIADAGISRRALTVATGAGGWRIISTNVNCAVLHRGLKPRAGWNAINR
jgi:hypothetical protein